MDDDMILRPCCFRDGALGGADEIRRFFIHMLLELAAFVVPFTRSLCCIVFLCLVRLILRPMPGRHSPLGRLIRSGYSEMKHHALLL